ncbi:MAG: isopentenyl phosphate kinase, partial [Candidatus Micrarchaeaceae archaeon]
MEGKLIMVKIGGSIATHKDKEKSANIALLKRILAEINDAAKETGARLVLGHGGGSYPHATAARFGLKSSGSITDANRLGFTLTQLDARELNTIIAKIAAELGMPVFPISPSSFGVVKAGTITEGTVAPVIAAIGNGYMPLVYGDCLQGADGTYGICSTEKIFEFLCGHAKPDAVISVSDLDGVYDSDPHKNPNAKLMPTIDSSNIDAALASSGGSMHTDVTGGMADKVNVLW